MNSLYLNKFYKYFNNIKLSFYRFPFTVLVGIMIAIISILFNHNIELLTDLQYENTLLVLAIAIPLSTLARLFYENYKKSLKIRVIINLIITLFLLTYYFFIPDDKSATFMIRYSSILIASYFIFLLISYGLKKDNYPIYILKLMTNFLITFLFSLVLYLGIILIVFTVDKLFDFYINSKIYFDIFITIAALFFPMAFLGRLPKKVKELRKVDYPNVIRLLISYIVIPILIAYTSILYLYFIKIIINREFDINLLNNLTIWYAIISILTLFFANPIREEKKDFYKFYPISMILPVIVLIISITKRISNYGVTPPRFFVIVIIIWLIYSLFRFIKKEEELVQCILSAGILLILLSNFNFLNAFNISFNIQNERFKNLLIQNEILVNEKIIKVKNMDDKLQKEISDFIFYFDRYGELEKIDYLPENFEYKDMKKVFGFSYVSSPIIDSNFVRYYTKNRESLISIKGYDYMINMNSSVSFNTKINTNLIIDFNEDDKVLTLKDNKKLVIKIDLIDLVNEIYINQRNQNFEDYNDATFIKENEKVKLAFIIESISFNSKKIDSEETYINFKLLINLK